jgi:hypothetical protein
MPFHIDRPIPIPMEDDLVHTDHDPFCIDPTCPSHEESDTLDAVTGMVEDGLLTPDEATRFVQGRQL